MCIRDRSSSEDEHEERARRHIATFDPASAIEGDQDEQQDLWVAAFRLKLSFLRLMALHSRALHGGVEPSVVEAATDSADPQSALIECIVAAAGKQEEEEEQQQTLQELDEEYSQYTHLCAWTKEARSSGGQRVLTLATSCAEEAVSYTHLTLPTICSV